jgi:hypothetical protein
MVLYNHLPGSGMGDCQAKGVQPAEAGQYASLQAVFADSQTTLSSYEESCIQSSRDFAST